jgi:hypothetical protein
MPHIAVIYGLRLSRRKEQSGRKRARKYMKTNANQRQPTQVKLLEKTLAAKRAKLAERIGPPRANKHRNTWTTCAGGHRHQSKKEATRCAELELWQKAGIIEGLNRKVRFHLLKGWWYECDFIYCFNDFDENRWTIEDVKGRRQKADLAYRLFRLKADLVEQIYGIQITET